MKIAQVKLPQKSILNTLCKGYHYTDCFQGLVLDENSSISSSDGLMAFFSSAPDWVQQLMKFRNRITSFFGLKPAVDNDHDKKLSTPSLEKGNHVGFIKIIEVNDHELVFGMDDKHLDFKGSLMIEQAESDRQKKMTISTVVKYNNFFGWFYFLLVKPFHKVIIKVMLKRAIIKLQNQG